MGGKHMGGGAGMSYIVLLSGDSTKLITSHTSLRRVGGKEEMTTKWFQRGLVGVREGR